MQKTSLKHQVYRDLNHIKEKLEDALRKVEKYKKRSNRLRKNLGTLESPKMKTKQQMQQGSKQLKKTLLFHNTIMSEIRKTYQNVDNRKARQLISKLVAGKILKKYRLVTMAKKEFGFSTKLIRTNMTRADKLKYTRKTQRNRVSQEVKEKITKFLERDDNSRATTGKKETITKMKNKMQKRFLVDSMQTLHLKFRHENPEVRLSYAEFCKK